MILSFDIVPESVTEHDEWHSREHMPERLSVPGFRRGTRWVSPSRVPRYFVMYEVAELDVLGSAAYLERLNNPTPWTAKMMKGYRGMTRGLCVPTVGAGSGLGRMALLVRFAPAPGREAELQHWLTYGLVPSVVARPGVVCAYLLERGLVPQMTAEQQIRGKDTDVRSVLLVTGYEADALTALPEQVMSADALWQHGAAQDQYAAGIYDLAFALCDREVQKSARSCGLTRKRGARR
jgi:hypothetical protein